MKTIRGVSVYLLKEGRGKEETEEGEDEAERREEFLGAGKGEKVKEGKTYCLRMNQ